MKFPQPAGLLPHVLHQAALGHVKAFVLGAPLTDQQVARFALNVVLDILGDLQSDATGIKNGLCAPKTACAVRPVVSAALVALIAQVVGRVQAQHILGQRNFPNRQQQASEPIAAELDVVFADHNVFPVIVPQARI